MAYLDLTPIAASDAGPSARFEMYGSFLQHHPQPAPCWSSIAGEMPASMHGATARCSRCRASKARR